MVSAPGCGRGAIRAFAFLLITATAQGQPTAGCDRGGMLSPQGVGPVTIGMTADSLRRVCRVVGEHKASEYSVTIMTVRVGADTVRAFVRGDRIRLLGMRGAGTVTQVDIHGSCSGRGRR